VLQLDSQRVETVELHSGDGLRLFAWYAEPKAPNGDTVLLLHGVGDNREGMIAHAAVLLRHGFSVLIPDARAHGESEGRLATYGLKERDDLVRWVKWLHERRPPHCLYGLGESMGAAILLDSLPVLPRLCAVVAESPFASFREIAYERIGQRLGATAWLGRTLLRPVVEFGLVWTRWRYGLDLEHAAPEWVHGETPLLLIHGRLDNNAPLSHCQRIKRSWRGPVDLWEVDGAGHSAAITAAPAEFESRVTAHFNRAQ
jgi:fermentation-respiration switch protein FrsA (DUF1100 family)